MKLQSFSSLWLLLFFVAPMCIMVGISLDANWQELFSLGLLKISLRTLLYTFLTTLFCLFLAIPIGYVAAHASPRWQRILLILVILPFWSSFIVRIFAWKAFLHPDGIVKQFLVIIGAVDSSTILLYNATVVILVMVYTYIPFAILPIYAASSKLDLSLFEAGMDLGLSQWRIFTKVYVPVISKAIGTAACLVFVPVLGAYIIPEIVGGPDNTMLGNLIVDRTFTHRNLPEASALSSLLAAAIFLPLMIRTWRVKV